MDREQGHIWIVCRERGATHFPIADKEAAEAFRAAGWRVTEVPRGALTESGLSCLGIRASGSSDD